MTNSQTLDSQEQYDWRNATDEQVREWNRRFKLRYVHDTMYAQQEAARVYLHHQADGMNAFWGAKND